MMMSSITKPSTIDALLSLMNTLAAEAGWLILDSTNDDEVALLENGKVSEENSIQEVTSTCTATEQKTLSVMSKWQLVSQNHMEIDVIGSHLANDQARRQKLEATATDTITECLKEYSNNSVQWQCRKVQVRGLPKVLPKSVVYTPTVSVDVIVAQHAPPEDLLEFCFGGTIPMPSNIDDVLTKLLQGYA